MARSSIGVGTSLGDATDAADADYEATVAAALEAGINVVDTAITYRHQHSERAVGRAIEAADMDREAVFVATKGGFVPFDRDRLKDAFVRLEEHVAAGDLRRYGVAT